MGLYYQAVMDKSKLKEANGLHNKIGYLKDRLERISRFEMGGEDTNNGLLRFLFPH